jgi:acyl-CoA reductase-like NAD-dependent aldehyde dehydrogenase
MRRDSSAAATLANHIDGEWTPSDSDRRLDVINPSTGERLAAMPVSSASDVDCAVTAALEAAPGWRACPLVERLRLLEAAAESIEASLRELAEIEASEMGRPVAIGAEWIGAGLAGFRASLALAREYPFEAEHGTTLVRRQPVGVVALVTPWNFPSNVILDGLGPLLAAGNTVVLKPSEKSPISAVRLIELIELPPGVLNLVLGDGSTGALLTAHEGIALTQFTGSVGAGRSIAQESGRQLRRVVLELGGKDAVIVDDGVDPVAVAKDVARGAFTNTGQICTSMERIYVHRNVADPFLAALVAEAANYPMTDPQGGGAGIGPLVDGGQRSLVESHLQDAVARGARVLVGGTAPPGPGFYFPATVLTEVTEEMLVMRDETFGPLAPVRVVADFDEALELAGGTDFGLAATVYTNDPAHVVAVGDLPAGIVWINRWQGEGNAVTFEPARQSGVSAIGHFASFDAATRATSVLRNPLEAG